VSRRADHRTWCAEGTDAPVVTDLDARAQQLVSLSAYSSAAVCLAYAMVGFVFGGPVEAATATFISCLALALVPLLGRFGSLVAGFGFLVVGTAVLSTLCVQLGTDTGLLFYFFVLAAATPMVVGITRIRLSAGTVVICTAAVPILYFTVPGDTGRAPDWLMVGSFVANCVAASLLAVSIVGYGLYQMRRAEAALEDAYDRSEALLGNILPRTVAQRLKEPAHEEIADGYDDASILFADIAGFTAMSSHTPPAEVVRFLDHLYTDLDALAEKYRLEKIKTIGDSYMVVGGVPDPRSDHLRDLARFALDMFEVAGNVAGADGAALGLRVGIATGPVVAGVVGSKKFFYDVWGDAVNLASRMESTGVVRRIQVTTDVRDRLAGEFAFSERGPIAVKGKGEQLTWFLEGAATATAPG